MGIWFLSRVCIYRWSSSALNNGYKVRGRLLDTTRKEVGKNYSINKSKIYSVEFKHSLARDLYILIVESDSCGIYIYIMISR